MSSYAYKRTDQFQPSSEKWRSIQKLGRSRRPLFIAFCCVIGLIYWHTSTSTVLLTPSISSNTVLSRDTVPHEKVSQEQWRQRIQEQIRQRQTPQDASVIEDKPQTPSKDETHIQKQQIVVEPGKDVEHDSIRTDATKQESLTQQDHGTSELQDSREVKDSTVSKEEAQEKRKASLDDPSNPHYYHSHDDEEVPEDLAGQKERKKEKEKKPAKKTELDEEERKSNVAKKEHIQEKIADHVDDLPKGPVAVQPDLDPQNEQVAKLQSPDQPAKEKVIEAESDEHLTLEETADSLPEIIHVTFEDATKDIVLQGWEDEWIANGRYDHKRWGDLEEPKIDFVYLWVNGSETAFQTTKRPFEENSVLNDPEGNWIKSHGTNRYRDWDELKYAVRSVEKYATNFKNKIMILVNSVSGSEAGKQIPTWLNDKPSTKENLQVLAQEEFFDPEKHVCLPTFNSLTIENQLFNTPSNTDYMYALSDDMLLTKRHAASDIVSPLFGPVMGFKTNAYNTVHPPTDADAHRFGEKPFLIYTSWLLNQRFGERKRKGQGHFGHSLSRSIMREAIGSFPGPELQSACKRFRGEPGFQLYSWFVTFHYLIERHREAMLWSLIMIKSDKNNDGFLNWDERRELLTTLEVGMANEAKASFRKRNFYHVAQRLEKAGLEPPRVHTDHTWTSLDGPNALQNIDCSEFDVNDCLAPGFSISRTDANSKNPIFSSAVVFERVARSKPVCGDCLLKLVLNTAPSGLSPVLPDPKTHPAERETVVKALHKYRYIIADTNAQFVMITDAEQIESTLTNKYVNKKRDLPGQLCLNDDVTTEDDQELNMIQTAMNELYLGLFPEKSSFER